MIRGGYGNFYGPVDVQIPDVDLSLGVVNQNKSAVENSGPGQPSGKPDRDLRYRARLFPWERKSVLATVKFLFT